MTRRSIIAGCWLAASCGGFLVAQGLDRAMLLKQPVDAWPTYNGDYSARRFSPLKQINSTNVQALSLLWATRFIGGPAAAPAAPGRGGAAPAVAIKATPLMVNGILYFSAPNNAWAVDARTGRELWHYSYPPS